jgi:hypothetical protein
MDPEAGHADGSEQPAWERQLWTGRPAWLARLAHRDLAAAYTLTDVRLTAAGRMASDDLLLQEIEEVVVVRSRLDRLLGTSTLVVERKNGPDHFVLRSVRHATSIAGLLELAASDDRHRLREKDVRAALAWRPHRQPGPGVALAGLVVVLVSVFAVTLLHGRATAVPYAPDDPIFPNGHKRGQAAIVRFMEAEVMPWARTTLGPVVGGTDHVTCETCHGTEAAARGWQMPGVAALPQPAVVHGGWEQYGIMDSQTRNAIYGYNAVEPKLGRARYMREHVMPGMARLLHRPAYDFTKPYEYNRAHLAFGCYHCHFVASRQSAVASRR